MRDYTMSSFDLFNTRHELITILAGDFYETRSSAVAVAATAARLWLPVCPVRVRFRLGHANIALNG